MLRIEELQSFPVNSKTDRDFETPMLLKFLQKVKDNYLTSFTLLDVGSHYSINHYAHNIRPLVRRYDGIDILPDPDTKSLLDHYYVGNAIDYPLEPYDVVICVSSIEHAGLSTYKGDYVKERNKLFEKCLMLTKKYMWISFPVGQEYIYPDQLAPITDEQLKRWEKLTSNFTVKESFGYTQGAQAGHPWYLHEKRDVAVKVPYIDYIGNQSICVLEIEK